MPCFVEMMTKTRGTTCRILSWGPNDSCANIFLKSHQVQYIMYNLTLVHHLQWGKKQRVSILSTEILVKYQENNENEDEINRLPPYTRTIFLQVGVGENY